MRRLWLCIAGVLLVVGSGGVVESQQGVEPNRYVPGELLVAFDGWMSDAGRADARRAVGAALKRAVRSTADGRLELMALPPGLTLEAARRILLRISGIRYAEPNWIYTHAAASNDPGYTGGYLWGLLGDGTTPANPYGSQAGEAWTAGFTGSSAVYVAVIDEGIDFNHPELAANIWTNPFDPADGIDNDGNGYVDDVRGWDFFGDNSTVFDGGPGSSVDSHGTHVAGTIGAVGGNGTGIVGVNWSVTIIPAKFLGPSGGTTADAVAAVDYITDLKQRHGLNIVATNNSWGGGGYSQALLDAITRGAKQNILFVAAAGNGNIFGVGVNNDATPRYPSNYDTTQGTPTESAAPYDAVIAVASITSSGARSSFSNYGQTTVDLGAPGSSIWSTTPNNSYSNYSGTSMATPHVTGAITLYATMNPGATALAAKTAVLDTAVATPTASLNTITVTNGRLNIGALLGPPVPVPNPPSGLSAAAVSPTRIDLAWTDASSDEDGFRVERCTGGTCTAFAQVASVGAGVAVFQDTTVSGSTTYRYRVLAFNAGGSSAPSNIAAATTPAPPAPPAAPSGLSAVLGPGPAQVTLSWTDNSGNETGFEVFRCGPNACPNSSVAKVGETGANAQTFVDTVPGAGRFWWGVRSFNASGTSAAVTTTILVP